MNPMWIQLKDKRTKLIHIINFAHVNYIKESFGPDSEDKVYMEFKGGGCLSISATILEIEQAIWSATARLTM